jgi:hypothetical protein
MKKSQRKSDKDTKEALAHLACSGIAPDSPIGKACDQIASVFSQAKTVMDPLLKEREKDGGSAVGDMLASLMNNVLGIKALPPSLKTSLIDYILCDPDMGITCEEMDKVAAEVAKRAKVKAAEEERQQAKAKPSKKIKMNSRIQGAIQAVEQSDIESLGAMLGAETGWQAVDQETDAIIMVAINRAIKDNKKLGDIGRPHQCKECPRFHWNDSSGYKSLYNDYAVRITKGDARWEKVKKRILICLEGKSSINIGKRDHMLHMTGMQHHGCPADGGKFKNKGCPGPRSDKRRRGDPMSMTSKRVCSNGTAVRYKCLPLWALHTSEKVILKDGTAARGTSLGAPMKIGIATICGPEATWEAPKGALAVIAKKAMAHKFVIPDIPTSKLSTSPAFRGGAGPKKEDMINIVAIGDSQSVESGGKLNYLTWLAKRHHRIHSLGTFSIGSKTIGYLNDLEGYKGKGRVEQIEKYGGVISDMAMATKPDYIIIQGGGNDMNNISRPWPAIQKSFTSIIEKAHAIKAKVIIFTLHALETRRDLGACPRWPEGRWCKKLSKEQWEKQKKDSVLKGKTLNAWIRGRCGGLLKDGDLVVDSAKILGELRFKKGMGSNRNIHYGNAGHVAIANEIAKTGRKKAWTVRPDLEGTEARDDLGDALPRPPLSP